MVTKHGPASVHIRGADGEWHDVGDGSIVSFEMEPDVILDYKPRQARAEVFERLNNWIAHALRAYRWPWN